ncbi:hypothetical protein [Gramella sp. AN32]|uniref:DUF4185 domain-containing protein n=1 Tax=Christiangramia antarctica TaxID=2058158 RepID=A0ABW5X8L0_9FLAO|nr:hypothetical protein [Gramella sp. AN32]MCM4157568.1 hypothetical protein [Gramella sp. AN32]
MLKYIKNQKTILLGSLSAIALLAIVSCKKEPNEEKVSDVVSLNEKMDFKVEPAPQWTEVFKRDTGWFGGDGIFAIPYSGIDGKESDSILFLFSDTMIGEITEDSLQPGYTMVNNSLAFYTKGKKPSTTEFYLAENDKNEHTAFFKPDSENNEYYWLGDGFVNPEMNGNLYVFSYRIRNTNTDDLLPFEEVGNDLLVIENKNDLPLKADKQLKIPFFNSENDSLKISFGVGIYTEQQDGQSYVYVYGVRGPNKELVVARTPADKIEDFDSWRFRAEDKWTKDDLEMQTLTDSVSNELSVSRLSNGQYALVYQEGGIYPKIYMRRSETPFGPFGKKQLIWDTTTEMNDPDLFTYNAKAHPAISKPGELLVSYNVNSFKFFDIIESKPHLYRPRFVRISFNTPK